MMQGLQEAMEELLRANERLCRGGHHNAGHHDINEPEQFIPPKGYSAPFSQPILETKTKGGVVMVVERPSLSDSPMEVGPLGATPTGATPREDSPVGERGGDASPMEEVSEGASLGEANEAVTTKKGSGDQPENNVVERQIGGRIFKLGRLLSQEEQYAVAAVIARHLDAFAWSASDMPGIDPDFLCHHLTMDTKVRPIRQRRRKFNK